MGVKEKGGWCWGPLGKKERWEDIWVSGKGSGAICICDAGSKLPHMDVRATGAGGSSVDHWVHSSLFTCLGRGQTTCCKSWRLVVGTGLYSRPLGSWSPTVPSFCPFPAMGTQLCPLQATIQQGNVLSEREKVQVGCTCCPELDERRGVSAKVGSAEWWHTPQLLQAPTQWSVTLVCVPGLRCPALHSGRHCLSSKDSGYWAEGRRGQTQVAG